MINFAPKFCEEGKKEILEILDLILPEDILLIEFEMIKRSNTSCEAQFTLKCRVNIKSKDDIDGFICKLGSKSGTTYQTGGQIWERNESHCSRICQHSVVRHGLRNEPTHAGPGRQRGSERELGKNTCCLATLSFSLSGDRLHSSYRHKISSTKQNKHIR